MRELLDLNGREVSAEQVNYAIHNDTTYEPATCEEIRCDGYRDGWATALPADDMRVLYIRNGSGRSFREYRSEEWNERCQALCDARNAAKQPGESLEEYTPLPLGVVVFQFSPGQPCFQASNHTKPVAVNPLFVVRDHGGQVVMRHSGIDPFVDDFRGHSEPLFHALQERMGEKDG